LMSQQEPGKRPSCALPYQLSAEGNLQATKDTFSIRMKADQAIFGKDAAGSPFTVYAPVAYTDAKGKTEVCRNWAFAAKAGDEIRYDWPLKSFEDGNYQLHLHGPNGFYREFTGSSQDPQLNISVRPELKSLTKVPTGNAEVTISNNGTSKVSIALNDVSYKKGALATKVIAPNASERIVLNLQNTFGWYDFAISASGNKVYQQRFAGRVETGKESFTDPLIDQV